MKKLLIICPHLSTGGLPQVVVNKISLLKENYNIKCVEYDFLGDAFVVQRNRIIDLLGKENLITFGTEKKEPLLKLIDEFNPEVISIEEFPEYFMSDEVTKEIYKKDREYKIFETTHDSSFLSSSKRWFPDKFIFVSAFNAFRYSCFDIPYEIIEYPVDIKQRNKLESQKKLGLDPSLKHVVCVGLFTQRKNQGYIFDIANKTTDKNILYHFVGNLADNFASYWKPLIESKPNNCIVWGERTDVDTFLRASDLFFFPSKGDKFNKELNPIAIKEALEYDLPMIMYNLDVYCGKYNNKKNIKFLTGNIDDDLNSMMDILGYENTNEEIILKFNKEENKIIFNYYGDKNPIFKVSIKCLSSGAPIYWFDYNPVKYSEWFVIPIPIHIVKFYENPFFRGFLLEFYNVNGNLLSFKEILVNEIYPRIPKLDFKPFDCSYRNYIEFFVEDIYSCFNINDMDVVLDIGANIGLFSKYMFEKKNAKHVILVEANPFLGENIETILGNDNSKSKVYLSPLSDKKETIEFNFSKTNSTIGTTEFSKDHFGYEELDSTIELQTITLDEIIKENNLKRISLFKCDIEGGEYKLFDSLTDEQMILIDMFLIEFHGNDGEKLSKVIEKLYRFGFDYSLHKFTYSRHSIVGINEPHGVLVTKKRN